MRKKYTRPEIKSSVPIEDVEKLLAKFYQHAARRWARK